MSLGVVDSLRSSGICVPDEVSIVGFDDPEWTTIVEPPLTVVAQPVYELGRTAAARLLEYIHGRPDGPRTTILPTSFVIRGSTAPIQGRGQAK
jgi:LacI family transcriptional regulator